MIDRIGTVYVENDTKLLWPIGSSVVYGENRKEQWCDQSVSLVYTEIKTELSAPIWSTTLYDEN